MGCEIPLQDQIYRKLRSDILDGRIKFNERLRQEELSKIFNVSRMPIRYALTRLENDGLVETIPNKGARVRPFAMEDVVEIFALRKILESRAMQMAVAYFTPEDLLQIKAFYNNFLESAMNNDYPKMIKANEDFHFSIYKKSGFPYLLEIIRDLWSRRPRYTFSISPGRPDQSAKEHFMIIAAIESGNEKRAAELIRVHIENAQQALIAELRKPKGIN